MLHTAAGMLKLLGNFLPLFSSKANLWLWLSYARERMNKKTSLVMILVSYENVCKKDFPC